MRPSFLLPFIATAALADPSIEKLDPALDALIASDAKIELLATGFKWSEGPVWLDGGLVFSDVPNNTAFRWKEGDKAASVFLKPSGSTADPAGQGSNGLASDAEGNLILCQHGDRCVARLGKDGKFIKLANQFEGRRFNSPNDLCIARDGSIFFTDPPYGLAKGTQPEIPFHGVYRLGRDGTVTALIKDIKFPNGIALSPDQKTLYIAVSNPEHPCIRAHDIDGGNGREWFNATPLKSADRKGSCDGMKVDALGNIWTTGPGGVLIISKEGRHLGTILTGQPTANCAFGDDGSTLYITSNMNLLRVRTKVKGTGF